MRLQSTLRLLVLGFALGATGTILGQEPTFANIDYPGATSTQALGINPRGDIVGVYTSAGQDHGFLLSGGNYTLIDFPGATTATYANAINARGDIVGSYPDEEPVRVWGLPGFNLVCFAGSPVLGLDAAAGKRSIYYPSWRILRLPGNRGTYETTMEPLLARA